QRSEGFVFQKFLTAYEPYVLIPSQLSETVLRLTVVFKNCFFVPERKNRKQCFQRNLPETVFFAVKHVYISLRKFMLLFHSGKHGGSGAVQIGKPRIILFRTVYGFCSKPHDNTKHSRVLIHIRIPFVRAVAVSDAGGAGHEILSLIGSGNTLHQNGHLFVLFLQTAEPS